MHPESSLLLFALLLFQWANLVTSIEPPTSDTEVTKIVFRGDSRSPKDVKADGGFQALGIIGPYSKNMMANGDSASLFLHMSRGFLPRSIKEPRNTIYVSTSKVQTVSEGYLHLKPGYLYRIHAGPTFVGLVKSLGNWYKIFHGAEMIIDDVAYQQEYSAPFGIPWDRVMGWTFLPQGANTPEAEREYVENEDYNASFDMETATESYPKLAAFPQQHPGAHEHPFNQFDAKKALEYAMEFMDANGASVRWRHRVPLMGSPQHATLEAAEVSKEALEITQVLKDLEHVLMAGDPQTGNEASEAAKAALKHGNEAISKVLDASYRITGHLRVVAQMVEDCPYLEPAVYHDAWNSASDARETVARVHGVTWTAVAKKLKQQVSYDKEKLLTPNIQQAATMVELYADMARGKLNQKIKSRARLSVALEHKEDSVQVQEVTSTIGMGLREAKSAAIQREVDVLSKVIPHYQQQYKSLKETKDEIKEIADQVLDEIKKQEMEAARTKEEAQKVQERMSIEQKAIVDAKMRQMDTIREAEKLDGQAASGTWFETALVGLGATVLTLTAAGLTTTAVATGAIGGTSATLGEVLSARTLVQDTIQVAADNNPIVHSVHREPVISQSSAQQLVREPARQHRREVVKPNSIDTLVGGQDISHNLRQLMALAITPMVERILQSALMDTLDEAYREFSL
ncbi:hypothetical protein DCS_05870 [Drechmeria coniospora]|uniref:Enterotoxin n=1 Tax=Drechmeria coniospora TaxID=98403 RepID=A0A151GPC4_DRECN|nr:hypothetical protein DCS_05870 [Drechmeria coniospora]KYK58852.1 hypothetical protein DCS_05870 [Drechmeria coniospora]